MGREHGGDREKIRDKLQTVLDSNSPANTSLTLFVTVRLMNLRPALLCLLAFGTISSRSDAADAAKVKAPAGWNVTIFAEPPNVSYPTCLSTAPNGDLYVGIDENGSIDAKPGRGRVVRCTDTDRDGRADKFVTFATMDSPRGIWFDNNVLYVQHPPFVTAFFDDNGDGKSDRSDVLVRGLGFDLKFRGADHTINGMRMGIDGFLYIACGDYGATNAVGKDGTRIQLYGGGVVRVRPDGTGLEIVSRGQRNIYDVAVSPELDLFTRDNTNDGDGWDVRLSHVILNGEYGYPTLFKKFGDEIVQPMAVYGGGSPCGALFMDEPGFPKDFGRALYTVDWGRNAIMRHPLRAKGASFEAEQEKMIELQRPTDMDVDGSGQIYISSWHGATFTYNGPNAGYIARVTAPGWVHRAFPELEKLTDEQLLSQVVSPSAFARLYAQREILRRGVKPTFTAGLGRLAESKGELAGRVAAIFTLRQLAGPTSHAALIKLASVDGVREFALRALGDDVREKSLVPAEPFVKGLTDANPRVRLQATTALGRLGKSEAAANVLPLTADADPMVSHVAVHALVQMRASDVCLKAFDSAGSAAWQLGAARVLQALHEPTVVSGVMSRLAATTDTTSRKLLLSTLARLYNREDIWTGKWWGTRPDTTGPYYKPVTWSESERILPILKEAVAKADDEALRWLVVTLQKNRVDWPELTPIVLRLAGSDVAFRAIAVDMFSGRGGLPNDAVPLFATVANSTSESPALRAKAIRSLSRTSSEDALKAAVSGLTQPGKAPNEISTAWEEFARDTRQSRNVNHFISLAQGDAAAPRALACAVLANLSVARVQDRAAKTAASNAVESLWMKPESSVALLQAINRLRLEAYGERVRSLTSDGNSDVASAARAAAKTLKLDERPGKDLAIEKLKYEDVLATVAKQKGNAKAGAEIFTRIGCAACHTMEANEAPKGPFLGGIGTRYSRAELCESILKPNAKIAQGFETQWFRTKDDEEIEGFVTREGGDDLDVRNVAGIVTTLSKKNILERTKRETSMMPMGLADRLTSAELASLLAYLEATKTNP